MNICANIPNNVELLPKLKSDINQIKLIYLKNNTQLELNETQINGGNLDEIKNHLFSAVGYNSADKKYSIYNPLLNISKKSEWKEVVNGINFFNQTLP